MDVHLKEFRARKRIHQYIAPIVKDILINGIGFVHSLDIRRKLNYTMGQNYKFTELILLLKYYDSTVSNARRQVETSYHERMASIISSIDEILILHAGLTPELIDIVQGIKRSDLFVSIKTFNPENDLVDLASPLLELLYRLRDLYRYLDKYLPGYVEQDAHPEFAMYERYQKARPQLRAHRRQEKLERRIVKKNKMK
jgi:hypothetical protein